MIHTQYREAIKKVPYKYQEAKDSQLKCQGTCSCDNGHRTQYDEIQKAYFIDGKPIQIPTVTHIPGWWQ